MVLQHVASPKGSADEHGQHPDHLVLESHDGRAPGADSEEKHEPVSDIDTVVVVDSLKALDPEWPIREADIARCGQHGRKVP
jgi:hypothetical protein